MKNLFSPLQIKTIFGAVKSFYRNGLSLLVSQLLHSLNYVHANIWNSRYNQIQWSGLIKLCDTKWNDQTTLSCSQHFQSSECSMTGNNKTLLSVSWEEDNLSHAQCVRMFFILYALWVFRRRTTPSSSFKMPTMTTINLNNVSHYCGFRATRVAFASPTLYLSF